VSPVPVRGEHDPAFLQSMDFDDLDDGSVETSPVIAMLPAPASAAVKTVTAPAVIPVRITGKGGFVMDLKVSDHYEDDDAVMLLVMDQQVAVQWRVGTRMTLEIDGVSYTVAWSGACGSFHRVTPHLRVLSFLRITPKV